MPTEKVGAGSSALSPRRHNDGGDGIRAREIIVPQGKGVWIAGALEQLRLVNRGKA